MTELFKCKKCRKFIYDNSDYCDKCVDLLMDEWKR